MARSRHAGPSRPATGRAAESRICPVSRIFRRNPALVKPKSAPAMMMKKSVQTLEVHLSTREMLRSDTRPQP